MSSVNYSLSAFGISWPATTTVDSQMQQVSGRKNKSGTEEHELPDRVLNQAIGYEQGTSRPYIVDRQRAMQVLTRKGQKLDGNPYRLQGVRDGTEKQTMPRTKDDFEVVYHSDALQAIRDQREAGIGRQVPYLNEEALAKLEAGNLFGPPEETWETVEFDNQNEPVSRFSPDSDSPPAKTGLFRSISKKVIGSVKRLRGQQRSEISAPLQDLRHEPEGAAGTPNAMRYAAPILTPAAELANRAGNVEEARVTRHRKPSDKQPKPTKGKGRYVPKPPPIQTPAYQPRKRGEAFVVGSPDRMTELGDFMDFMPPASIPEDAFPEDEAVPEDDSYDRGRRIQKVSPPASSQGPMPSRHGVPETSAHAMAQRNMAAQRQTQTMSALYKDIDEQMAELMQEQDKISYASYNDPRIQESLARMSEWADGVAASAYEDRRVPKYDIETYIEGDHTLWRARERVGSVIVAEHAFRQTRVEENGEDEAAQMMKRLEALRR